MSTKRTKGAPPGKGRGASQRERPEWVPQWAWDEYLEQTSVPSHAPHFDMWWRVMHDPRAACVWTALERRREVGKARFEMRIDSPSWTIFASAYEPAAILLAVLAAIARGPNEEELLAAPERRRRGTLVAQTASSLSDMLWEFRPYGQWALWLEQAIREHTNELIKVLHETLPDDKLWDHVKTAGLESVVRDLIGTAVRRTTFSFDRQVSVVARAAKAWAKSNPVVVKKSAPTALRTYFIRELTRYFELGYAAPLQDQVAALASIVFECDITRNTVRGALNRKT